MAPSFYFQFLGWFGLCRAHLGQYIWPMGTQKDIMPCPAGRPGYTKYQLMKKFLSQFWALEVLGKRSFRQLLCSCLSIVIIGITGLWPQLFGHFFWDLAGSGHDPTHHRSCKIYLSPFNFFVKSFSRNFDKLSNSSGFEIMIYTCVGRFLHRSRTLKSTGSDVKEG